MSAQSAERPVDVTRLERLLRWIEPEDNPRNTVYGTIGVGLVIAAEDPTTETYPSLIAATVVAIITYWIAHSYAYWVAERLRRGTTHQPSWSVRGLFGAAAHEWPLAEGAAAPIAALLIAWAAGLPMTAADTAALSTAAACLVLFEIAGGLRRGVAAAPLVANACLGLLLGSSLFVVKDLLH